MLTNSLRVSSQFFFSLWYSRVGTNPDKTFFKLIAPHYNFYSSYITTIWTSVMDFVTNTLYAWGNFLSFLKKRWFHYIWKSRREYVEKLREVSEEKKELHQHPTYKSHSSFPILQQFVPQLRRSSQQERRLESRLCIKNHLWGLVIGI